MGQLGEELTERRRETVDLRCHGTRPGTMSHLPEVGCGRSAAWAVVIEHRNEVPADLPP